MMKSVLLSRYVSVLALLAVLLSGCGKSPPAFRGTEVPDVTWGQDFTLTTQDSKPLATSSLRGKVQVLFFGYTHCPDICAPTLARLGQASKALGQDAAKVQVLFITVDPKHDTPAQLRKFLGGFEPGIIGLTGSSEEISAVATDHVAYYKQDPKNPGQVAHTGMLFVKDAAGRMRLLIRETASVEDIVHDLKLLVAEAA